MICASSNLEQQPRHGVRGCGLLATIFLTLAQPAAAIEEGLRNSRFFTNIAYWTIVIDGFGGADFDSQYGSQSIGSLQLNLLANASARVAQCIDIVGWKNVQFQASVKALASTKTASITTRVRGYSGGSCTETETFEAGISAFIVLDNGFTKISGFRSSLPESSSIEVEIEAEAKSGGPFVVVVDDIIVGTYDYYRAADLFGSGFEF